MVAAIGGRRDVVVVAQSMGAFTAPMACARSPVRRLVLVNAMIPLPGETAGVVGPHRLGAGPRRGRAGGRVPRGIRPGHLLPARRACGGRGGGEGHAYAEADIAFSQPCAIERWPDVPTRVIAGRDDRFFPLEFQRQVARERLGAEVHEVPGGHLAALSRPAELTDQLIRY